MKAIIFFASLLSLFGANGQSTLTAFANHKCFQTHEKKPYLETHISVLGSSISYQKVDETSVQSKIQITQIFTQEDSVVDFKKYTLLGPKIKSDSGIVQDLVDVQRFSLVEGAYLCEVELLDLCDSSAIPVKVSIPIVVRSCDHPCISDIELVDSYSKSKEPKSISNLTKGGYDIVPAVSNYFNESFNKIAYYYEVYNSKELSEGFLLTTFIENSKTLTQDPRYVKRLRKKPQEVLTTMGAFNISELATGKYNLVAEVRNRNNEVISVRRTPFERMNLQSNAIGNYIASSFTVGGQFVKDIDSADLLDYLPCLSPIANRTEKRMLNKKGFLPSDSIQRLFFYSFWQARSAKNPEEEWLKYKTRVDDINDRYSNNLFKGCETDRGRIFLQYGEPNSVLVRDNEPSCYPYEIWHYYHIGKFNNRRFVFYDPSLLSDSYVLLHSDMLGEIKNPRWQLALKQRNTGFDSLDDDGRETKGQQDFGNGAGRDFFDNPR